MANQEYIAPSEITKAAATTDNVNASVVSDMMKNSPTDVAHTIRQMNGDSGKSGGVGSLPSLVIEGHEHGGAGGYGSGGKGEGSGSGGYGSSYKGEGSGSGGYGSGGKGGDSCGGGTKNSTDTFFQQGGKGAADNIARPEQTVGPNSHPAHVDH